MEGGQVSSGGGGFNPAQAVASSTTMGMSDIAQGHSWGSGLFGGVGGAMADITGATGVADAQGRMANAQLAQQHGDRTMAMQMMAPTNQEIQQLNQAMALNQQSIEQGQALINSADPALRQAGQQALDLMQGKSAASLEPLHNQRAQQKEQLKSQLEQQLGSGYATSSAGIQALNNFDQQTSNLTNQAQQGAIQSYMGMAGGAYQMGAGQQQQGFQNSLMGNQQRYGWQQGQAGALMGTPVNPGLQYSGQLANAQASSNFGIGGLVGMAGGAANAYNATQQGGLASAKTAAIAAG